MIIFRLAPLALAMALAVGLAGGAAAATLNGKSFTLDYMFPDINTVYPATNGPINGTAGAGAAAITVEDVATITVDFVGNVLNVGFSTILTNPTWNDTSFNGIRIAFANTPDIASFTKIASNFGPVTPSFSGSTLFLNWPGATYNSDSAGSFEVALVPVPAALPLLATALAGVAGLSVGKRRRVG